MKLTRNRHYETLTYLGLWLMVTALYVLVSVTGGVIGILIGIIASWLVTVIANWPAKHTISTRLKLSGTSK